MKKHRIRIKEPVYLLKIIYPTLYTCGCYECGSGLHFELVSKSLFKIRTKKYYKYLDEAEWSQRMLLKRYIRINNYYSKRLIDKYYKNSEIWSAGMGEILHIPKP